MKKPLGAIGRPIIPDLMQHSMGRGGREAVIREALERVDGKPTPELGVMQVAMSTEAEIRLVHEVIRDYLRGRGLSSTIEWAHASAASDDREGTS